jgi:hypothetical protein
MKAVLIDLSDAGHELQYSNGKLLLDGRELDASVLASCRIVTDDKPGVGLALGVKGAHSHLLSPEDAARITYVGAEIT